MDLEKIGKFIKELRIEKGLSQNNLSEKIHITRQAISNWENGKTLPDSDILKELSKLFKVSIDEILSGERHKNENHLEEITLSLVDQHNKNQSKIKKMFIALLATISCFTILFLFFYFITNYNSIKVYLVAGRSENFVIREGMIISTQHRNYVRIGEIVPISNQEIESIELYFKDNKDKKKSLYNINSEDYIIFNYSIHKNEEKKYIDNLYIDIKTKNNNIEKMKLKIHEDYKNSFYYNTKNIRKRDLNYEDNNLEVQKEEEKIEPEVIKEIIYEKEIIPGEIPDPIIIIQKEHDFDYLKVIKILGEKGTRQIGKNTIEYMKDDLYVNVSCNNYDVFVDTLKDNNIESMQINLLNKLIVYQKYENYIEVENKKLTEDSEEYNTVKNNMEELLNELINKEG